MMATAFLEFLSCGHQIRLSLRLSHKKSSLIPECNIHVSETFQTGQTDNDECTRSTYPSPRLLFLLMLAFLVALGVGRFFPARGNS